MSKNSINYGPFFYDNNYFTNYFSLIFLLLGISSLFVPIFPILQNLTCHGKRIPKFKTNKKQSTNTAPNTTTTTTTTTTTDARYITQIFFVPKSFFIHMYVIGIIANAICIYLLIYMLTVEREETFNIFIFISRIQGVLMFQLHVLRRLWECIYITTYGKSCMDISVYLVGLLHYVVVPCCLFCSVLEMDHYYHNNSYSHNNSSSNIGSKNSNVKWQILQQYQPYLQLLSIAIYVVASRSQYQSHYILFNLKNKKSINEKNDKNYIKNNDRTEVDNGKEGKAVNEEDINITKQISHRNIGGKRGGNSDSGISSISSNNNNNDNADQYVNDSKSSNFNNSNDSNKKINDNNHSNDKSNEKQQYSLPTEKGFLYLACPHYFAEVLLYFSFNILLPHSASLLCVTFWVICNLTVIANYQYIWYMNNFPEKINKKWKRIFPFIW